MIDIHSHVLPAVDDGAKTIAEAIRMCRMAARDGCETLVCTPHQRNDTWPNDRIRVLRSLLEEVRSQVGDTPRLLLGGEIRVDSDLVEDMKDISAAGILSLADSRYLLIEFDRSLTGPDPVVVVDDLTTAGWRPILAHPEFLPQFNRSIDLVEELVSLGALVQVTAMSVTGEFGGEPQASVFDLFEAGLVHFVASDAHGARWRPPGLSKARKVVKKHWGLQTADRVTQANPLAVLRDLPIQARD